ncbi:MAG: hypothetical protein ABSF78_14200, partial [Candidatus Acidiferrales bacterium]
MARRPYGMALAFVLLCSSLLFVRPAAASTATFLRTDNTTQGNWHGVYGADGYSVAGDSQSLPSYAAFTPVNQDNHIWNNAGPTETRDLETGGGTGRIAAAWYVDHFSNPPNFNLNVNITDGNTHQFALYALDWDSGGRIETIQITDANTNAVLDTRYVSNFVNGVYYIWNISG